MSTGRVTSTPVRSTATNAESTKSARAKEPEVTSGAGKALGWATAGKSGGFTVRTASIGDEGLAISEKVAVPKGFKAQVTDQTNKKTEKVHGTAVTLEQSAQQLTVTGPGGKKISLGTEATAHLTELAGFWKSSVADAKKAPKNEYPMLDWDSASTISGLGTAGALFSVHQTEGGYTGGAHPNMSSSRATWDTRTGQQVTLDSLLSQKQVTQLVNDVMAKLKKAKGPEGVGSDAFTFGGDKTAMHEVMNTNFAVVTDKSGKVSLDFAWDSGIHALGGLSTHVVVDAPNDPAFRAKLGLE